MSLLHIETFTQRPPIVEHILLLLRTPITPQHLNEKMRKMGYSTEKTEGIVAELLETRAALLEAGVLLLSAESIASAIFSRVEGQPGHVPAEPDKEAGYFNTDEQPVDSSKQLTFDQAAQLIDSRLLSIENTQIYYSEKLSTILQDRGYAPFLSVSTNSKVYRAPATSVTVQLEFQDVVVGELAITTSFKVQNLDLERDESTVYVTDTGLSLFVEKAMMYLQLAAACIKKLEEQVGVGNSFTREEFNTVYTTNLHLISILMNPGDAEDIVDVVDTLITGFWRQMLDNKFIVQSKQSLYWVVNPKYRDSLSQVLH